MSYSCWFLPALTGSEPTVDLQYVGIIGSLTLPTCFCNPRAMLPWETTSLPMLRLLLNLPHLHGTSPVGSTCLTHISPFTVFSAPVFKHGMFMFLMVLLLLCVFGCVLINLVPACFSPSNNSNNSSDNNDGTVTCQGLAVSLLQVRHKHLYLLKLCNNSLSCMFNIFSLKSNILMHKHCKILKNNNCLQ